MKGSVPERDVGCGRGFVGNGWFFFSANTID